MRMFKNGFIVILALLVFTRAHIAVTDGKLGPEVTVSIVQEADANVCQYNAAGNWSTAGTWTNCGGVAPTSADTCNIGTGTTTGTLTVDGTTGSPNVCGSVDFTGFTGTLTHAASKELDIYGSLTIVSGMTYTPNAAAILKFKATSTGFNITTAGKSLPQVTFDGVGGGWTHQDNIAIAGAVTWTILNGAWDLNGKTLNSNSTSLSFNSNNSNTRSITCGAGTINIGSGGNNFDISTTTNLTFSCGSGTIAFLQAANNSTFNGGGLSYGTLTSTANTTGSLTITGVNTFGTLTLSQGNSVGTFSGYGYLIGANQTVTGTCTFNGNSIVQRDWIRSDTKGTARQISCGTISSLDANFEDITGAGASAPWDLSNTSTARGGDLGGNSGITFASPKTCWFNTSASANLTDAHWFTTDGGASACGTTFPLPQDTAAFGTGYTGVTLTMNIGGIWSPKLDFSTATAGASPTIAFTGNWIYTRDIVMKSGITPTGTGQITFDGSGTRTIKLTTAGNTITSKIAIFGGPNLTVQQQDNLTDNRAVAEALAIGSGTASCCGIWDQNTHTITLTGSGSDVGMEGGTLLYSANITGTAFVFQYNSGITSHMTPKTGYYQSDLTNTVMTVTTLPASGGSSTFGN